jgi:uncharacterized protein YbjT (DUF2867 family)
MQHHTDTILVVGATGRQGGAVARKLLKDGWRIKALTRNRNGSAASALAELGAEVVEGNMDVPASLEAAMRDVSGVFSVQQTVGSPGTPEGFTTDQEVQQGKNVADAAKATGIRRFVFSSVGGADRDSGIRNFEAKWKIEQHIRAIGLPAAIVRPVTFMENYVDATYGIKDGTLTTPLAPSVNAQLIAIDDVGAFVALVFDRFERFVGKAIEIAGDNLTPPQIAEAVSRETGRDIPYIQIPIEAIRNIDPQMAIGAEWMNTAGYKADIAAVRELLPDLLTFDTWLKTIGKAEFEKLWSNR